MISILNRFFFTSQSSRIVDKSRCSISTFLPPYIPTLESLETLYNGVKFKELPIIFITVKKNNVHFYCTDYLMSTNHFVWSCGREGFKGCMRSTSVASQTAANSFAKKLLRLGIHTARVRVKGVFETRNPAIRGIHAGGINIVSLTDTSIIYHKHRRLRNRRRV
ncbi:MAG: 28S ribosomal protein S11, mitochondrial [Marteilia pararefringens]